MVVAEGEGVSSVSEIGTEVHQGRLSGGGN